uniref:Uncharacterized protein n=1 Tax=Anguilla anguilla TaxID=7936 RepID=A0A0E9QCC0_ANGAN
MKITVTLGWSTLRVPPSP